MRKTAVAFLSVIICLDWDIGTCRDILISGKDEHTADFPSVIPAVINLA